MSKFGFEPDIAELEPELPRRRFRVPKLSLKRQKAFAPKARKPRKIRRKDCETLVTYDRRPEEGINTVYEDLMPFDELAFWLPLEARHVPDIRRFRLLGLGVGGCFGIALVASPTLIAMNRLAGPAADPTGTASMLGLLGGLVGMIAGWFLAPLFAGRPFWTIARLLVEPAWLYDEVRRQAGVLPVERDEDGNKVDVPPPEPPSCGYFVVPLSHTHMYGMPPDVREILLADIAATEQAEEAEEPAPALVGAGVASTNGHGAVKTASSRADPGGLIAAGASHSTHEPHTDLAAELWAQLQMMDEKKDMQGGTTTSEKIQAGAMLILAVSMVLVLLFMWITSTGGTQ